MKFRRGSTHFIAAVKAALNTLQEQDSKGHPCAIDGGTKMKRFSDAGRRAIKDGNLYAALTLALTIPDVCGSLEEPGPGKSQARYTRWCKQWIEPKYSTKTLDPMTGRPHVWITDEQIYQLRCSLIHSGSDEIEKARRTGVDRFFFFDQTRPSGIQKFANCKFNGVDVNIICLSAADFCEKLFEAAEEWDASVVGNEAVQVEKEKLLFVHSKGAAIYGVIIA